MKNRPDVRAVDAQAFWRGRLNSIPKSVKLAQVAYKSLPIQLCTACLGASCQLVNGLCQLVTPRTIKMKILFLLLEDSKTEKQKIMEYKSLGT